MKWHIGLEGAARRIAETNDTPLRVFAGPGTGKTFSMMRRVMRLLETGVDAKGILVCTFTRTAAKDLEAELQKLEVKGASNVWAGTIHAFCFRLLSKGDVLDITGRHPRPLLGFEERFLLEDLREPGGEGIRQLRKRLRAFSAAWARMQAETPGWPTDGTDRELLSRLMPWLRFHECMLIGELVPQALSFLQSNPASPLRPRYGHVLVDEYQDLNRAEQVLLDSLTRDGSLTVIGDENQSVYSFKFAHPEGIRSFGEIHEGTHDESLVECRRCPRRVVSMANELIQHNDAGRDRTLRSRATNPDGEVLVVQWPDLAAEAGGIATFVRSRVAQRRVGAGDVLVLTSRRQFGYAIRDAMNERGIAAHSFFHEELLDGPPASLAESATQQAFSLLTLLARPSDRVALRCWVGYGSSTLRSGAWKALWDYCARTADAPQKALQDLSAGTIRIARTSPIVERYRMLVGTREKLERLTGGGLLDAVFPPTSHWAADMRQLAQNFDRNGTATDLLELLQRSVTQPELPTDVDYVRVMSLHKSKGLTARMVVVAGLVDGIIPTVDGDATPDERERLLQEQRRLFYVAITRPTETLVLSSMASLDRAMAFRIGARVSGRGGTVNTLASPFIRELGPGCPQAVLGEDVLHGEQ